MLKKTNIIFKNYRLTTCKVHRSVTYIKHQKIVISSQSSWAMHRPIIRTAYYIHGSWALRWWNYFLLFFMCNSTTGLARQFFTFIDVSTEFTCAANVFRRPPCFIICPMQCTTLHRYIITWVFVCLSVCLSVSLSVCPKSLLSTIANAVFVRSSLSLKCRSHSWQRRLKFDGNTGSSKRACTSIYFRFS